MTAATIEKTLTVEINGKACQAKAGQTIIQVADREGQYIPRFCYHEKLSVVANCRMCLVEVANVPKPLPACATPVTDGMVVHTASPMAVQAQRSVMAFLLINHPLDCPVCDQGGNCELQDLSMGYGSGKSDFTFEKRAVKDLDIGPLIKTHMTRCIHCTRCVRFGEEIAGMRELGATGRGEHMEIGTYVSRMVQSEMSGNIIDICPVGALTSKPFAFQARHWEMRQHPSIAPHDAVGSNIYIHHRAHEYDDGRTVMKVAPREATSINENWLSDRDRFSYLGVHHHSRLKQPEIKRGDEWYVVSWMEALAHVQQSLETVLDQEGPDAMAGLASTQCSTETLYLWQMWLRGLGCHHIDSRPQQQDCRDDACPMFPPLNDIAGVASYDTVLLLGCCLRQEMPLLNYHVRKAVLQGAKVCSINAVASDANYQSTLDIVLTPWDWVPALATFVAHLLGERTPAAVHAYANECDDDTQIQLLETLWKQGEQRVILIGADAMSHPMASVLRQLCALLQREMGGSFTVACLPMGPNHMGALHAGALPQRDIAGEYLPQSGEDAMHMMSHHKKAYMLLNVEPEWDHADPLVALAALDKADCVVSMTPFVSDTMRSYATVLLPIAPFGFESGSMINVSGVWQSFNALPFEDEQVKPAWFVCKQLAGKMSVPGLDFSGLKAVREHLRSEMPATSVGSLDQWEWPELVDDRKGFQLMLRTHMYQVDPLVRRSEALQAVADVQVKQVLMHPADANDLSIQDGNQVIVENGPHRMAMSCVLSDQVAKGAVLIYRHDGTQLALRAGGHVKITRGAQHAH